MTGSRLPLRVGRRAFLQVTAGASAAVAAGPEAQKGPAARPVPAPGELVDVNVYLSRWPLRRYPCDEPDALVASLRKHGVVQAWAGTFDGLLHKDIAGANARLAEDCRRHGPGLLVPLGSINPLLPDWPDDLRRCVEVHQMPGIRLHPNYHGYGLDQPELARLLELAAQRNLIVQVVVIMEDERMMHPLLRVPPVNVAPLAALVQRISGLRLVLVNAMRTVREPALAALVRAGQVYVEIAMLEGVGGLERLLAALPVDRVLFGSFSPMFYFESAWGKLRESELTPHQRRAIAAENAKALLGPRGVPPSAPAK